MTTKLIEGFDLGYQQGCQTRAKPDQPDLCCISLAFIAGDLTVEAAIEMANDYHKRQAEEAGPPF